MSQEQVEVEIRNEMQQLQHDCNNKWLVHKLQQNQQNGSTNGTTNANSS
jgi:hypothetical protein